MGCASPPPLMGDQSRSLGIAKLPFLDGHQTRLRAREEGKAEAEAAARRLTPHSRTCLLSRKFLETANLQRGKGFRGK